MSEKKPTGNASSPRRSGKQITTTANTTTSEHLAGDTRTQIALPQPTPTVAGTVALCNRPEGSVPELFRKAKKLGYTDGSRFIQDVLLNENLSVIVRSELSVAISLPHSFYRLCDKVGAHDDLNIISFDTVMSYGSAIQNCLKTRDHRTAIDYIATVKQYLTNPTDRLVFTMGVIGDNWNSLNWSDSPLRWIREEAFRDFEEFPAASKTRFRGALQTPVESECFARLSKDIRVYAGGRIPMLYMDRLFTTDRSLALDKSKECCDHESGDCLTLLSREISREEIVGLKFEAGYADNNAIIILTADAISKCRVEYFAVPRVNKVNSGSQVVASFKIGPAGGGIADLQPILIAPIDLVRDPRGWEKLNERLGKMQMYPWFAHLTK